MPAVDAQLPNDFFNKNLKWWIISAPPYWCQNDTPTGSPLATDDTYLGVSVWNETPGGSNVFVRTTGVKYAYTATDAVSPAPQFVDANGGPVWTTMSPLNKAGGVYSPEWDRPLSGEYLIGANKIGLYFGPYDLNKTTDATPYPQFPGDIVIIATGSDVLGGVNEGSPYSITDSRSFNLLFYSTGSNNANDLASSLAGSANQLPDYLASTRFNYVRNYSLMAFVALSSDAAPELVKWWPITWNSSNTYRINSINES